MAPKKKTVVVTYNGVDGACAAAMVLLKEKGADVVVSSAARIGEALSGLGGRERLSTVHICGLGVYCDWGDVERAAWALEKKGVSITWYCGRGYLEERQFGPVCTTVFTSSGTNTRAVSDHLDLGDHPASATLLAIAESDPQVGLAVGPPGEIATWRDLVEATCAKYFKYLDGDAYIKTIRKLATLARDRDDEETVRAFRENEYRYMLDGTSAAIGALKSRIQKCAHTGESVLITGETGTGKEHVARLIHEESSRKIEAFVPVNCALFAGNAGLANSTLFGHVKGAFTGAIRNRTGALVTADGGTLFLDELGELPLEVQVKLLRVLEDWNVTPEGADKPARQVDARLVAATNSDLPAMTGRGEFRADLFHRIGSLRLHVPALRERPEDIKAIVVKTLRKLADEGRKRRLSAKDLQALKEYGWPGNIRQLIKLIRRAVLLEMSIAEAIDEERVLGVVAPERSQPGGAEGMLPSSINEIRPMRDVRCEYAARALALHGGNYRAAAGALEVSQNTLRSWLSGAW